jgi:hypothetical protein
MSEAQAARGPVTHSFIVEHGFHDHPAECAFLNNNANLKKLAQAQAKAIAEYFGLKVEAPVENWYRVRKTWEDAKSQIGAFKNLEYAKNRAKETGLNVYDNSGKCVYTPTTKTVEELAREVILGKWGVGADRKKRLTAAGYDYAAVQKKVNELLS